MFYINSKQVLAQENTIMAGSTLLRMETDLGRHYLG